MPTLLKKITLALTIIISSLGGGVAVAQATLSSLEALIAKEDYKQAWEQAQQLTKTNEGDPRFDFLYGLSALETGNYDYAVFALDRVVVRQPYAVRPRLELARAYMQIDNREAALREFREVLKLNPPPTVRENVNRFVTALSIKDKKLPKWSLDSRFSAGAGYDSNANFGAESALFETPVFGTVTLNELSVKQSSPFGLLQGQFNYRYISSDRLSWFADTNLGQKIYKDAKEFDLRQLDISGGAIITSGQQQYRLSLKSFALWLDDEHFKTTNTLTAGIAHDLGNGRVWAGTLGFEDFDYPQQKSRNGQGYSLSTSYGFETNNTRHRINGMAKQEQIDRREGMHHARDILGIGYTISHTWDNGHISSFTADYQSLQHQGNDPIYAKKRHDKRLGLSLGHAVKLSKQISLFANAGLINNQSNLKLYDTSKTYIQAGVNYHF